MKFITPIVVMLLQVSPVVAQAIRVNGTSVALAPPAGFVPSSRFPGFERPDLQSSVMVTEVPGPVADISRGMTAASLATRGITLISSTRQLVDGRQALLLKVSQPAGGMTVHKWMIVSGDARTTVMIVATFPQEHESQIGDAMKDSLLTARWTVAAAPPDHFEGLSFRISPTTSLKIAGRMSNMLMLTESGQMGPLGPTAALFVIGTSLARVDVSDLKAFATTRASQTTQLKALRLSEQGATAIGNEAAYELVAEGTDIATGRLVTLYQVVLPDPQGYVLMQGMVDSTRAATMVPEFRKRRRRSAERRDNQRTGLPARAARLHRCRSREVDPVMSTRTDHPPARAAITWTCRSRSARPGTIATPVRGSPRWRFGRIADESSNA